MAGVRATGAGPVAITDEGAHRTIPLSAVSFEKGAIKVAGWPPYDNGSADFKKAVDAWLGYLAAQTMLGPDTSGAEAPAGPAFLVEATHPGATGNAVTLEISNVHAQVPPPTSTLDLKVTAKNVYEHLTLANIADTIGTADGQGSKPGLVFLSAPPSTDMPDAGTVPMTGSPPHADVKGGSGTAFTLSARPDGGGGTFEVEIVPGSNEFGLNVTWSKTVANKTLPEHAAEFAYVLAISAPPGGFGVPREGTVTLSGGTDPGTVPPRPAKASAPSA